MKVAKHKWMRLECEGEMFSHVVPESDIKPHGVRITDVKYELSHVCSCHPKIEYFNRKGEEYVKPLVIHNSFEQDEYLDDIIK